VGKITVKHYLNKRLSPYFEIGERFFYTVYVQITVNRKTTQIRSLTDFEMTDKGFDLFLNGIRDWDEQKKGDERLENFEQEKDLIQKGIAYIENISGEKYNYQERNIRTDLERFLEPANETLTKAVKKIDIQGNNNFDSMLLAMIKDEEPLYRVKNIFKATLNIDITKHINKDFLYRWQLVDILGKITDTQKYYLYWVLEDLPKIGNHKDIKLINYIVTLANAHFR